MTASHSVWGNSNMAQAKRPAKVLRKQPINRRVMTALLPCIAGSVYFFGWRCLFVVVWSVLIGFIVEFIFSRRRGEPVSEAVFVTSTIFALIMPPTVPLHVLTIGVAFAVAFAKEVFGGFGRNIFNPAMAGRCFVYVCFPVALTASWAPASQQSWGALDRWTTVSEQDAITSATPMAYLKAGKLTSDSRADAVEQIPLDIGEEQTVSIGRWTLLKGLLFGRISGTMGVTSAVLILIGGLYLFWTRTASRAIIITLVVTYAVLNQVLYAFGVMPVPGALPAVLGGGFLFGAFFMATDPVSAPRTEPAKIIYGVIIAVCTTVIRNFSIFNGGLMFSILIGNMFAPILDYAVMARKSGKAAGEGN
ncbi:MAG: RnfABCDGE type electron transport complex subunit D [Sedimentisphaerales bacterium]|nr:RnfABCDGE type electron transport complex subunit D [Sedimentisphaerales bacterium]